MFKHNVKDLSLFEIKLKSHHKDLILVKGNEYESDPIPFEGSVKLLIPQDMHVKRIRLCLVGELNVEFFERDENRVIVDQVYDRLCLLKTEWTNLLTNAHGEVKYGNYGDTFIPFNKLESKLKKQLVNSKPTSKNGSRNSSRNGSVPPSHTSARPAFIRTKSQPSPNKLSSQKDSSIIKVPKSGIDGTPYENLKTSSYHSFLLPKGNYNLPFKVNLPANVCETVEGLNPGKVLYRMDCIIERGRFEKVFHKTKHVRIVRTLHPQNLNLVESIDINNTWPGKVQYNVSIPKKGIALGSSIPIHILIVPIAKGLKLKNISGVIVQHYNVQHSEGRSPEFEELFGKQSLSIGDPSTFPLDQWNIKSHFKVPENLKSITQSCDLKNNIVQVKHRLRISIQLKNKEGHVSELRANLPVCVYISANVGHVIGRHFDVDHHHGTFTPVNDKEDILFKKDRDRQHSKDNTANPQSPPAIEENHDITADDDQDAEDDEDLDRAEDAPPLYQQHVFDKIYDSSLPQTPLEQFRSQSMASSPVGSARPSMQNVQSYFDIPRNIDSYLDSTRSPNLDINVLLKVPSYDQAVDDDDDDDTNEDLAPSYDDGYPSLSKSVSIASMAIPSHSKTNQHHYHLSLPKTPKFGRHKQNSNIPSSAPHSPVRGFEPNTSFSGHSISARSSSTDLSSGKPSSNLKIHGVPKILHKKK
ncbi:hypothetical protein HYPBUDRAFT_107799 [Hyphopichia burtonii NRRL Y-1933]|uniref:Arrestin C-terminal-like domain-containing protein n=1 Tax=Hyphopichia burtonii NRRL Y-1933 TaxID=984485 RepID=A0A1E4RM68_9ASCO|nr:hypothetical protein HYPBUDRAFT_107799 [Hyphopichia burtonii NRRL Y-1933]ODV68281.1 hypothetical protein HYPBUDRAFT_107799 [Hyphopichia burtonii NRRL Y-1933]